MPAASSRQATDRFRVTLITIPGLLLGVGLGLGKIVRDCSLTCNSGYRFAPLAIVAVALTVIPLANLAMRVERAWGYRRWQLRSLLLGITSLLVFRALTFWLNSAQGTALTEGRPDAAWLEALRWTYLAFYVRIGALATFLGANVLSGVLRAFAAHDRIRAAAALPFALTIGGLLGSVAASESVEWFGSRFDWRYETVRDNLMIAMAACLLLQMPVVVAIDRILTPLPAPPASPVRLSLIPALRSLAAHRATRRVAIIVLLGGAADSLVAFGFYWLVSLQVGQETGRTVHFATFYAWLNGLSLGLLALGLPRLVPRFGVRLALLALPLAAFAGAAVLAAHGRVAVMYALRLASTSLRTALYEPALNGILVTIPGAGEPTRLLRGLVPRMGEALGALVALAFSVTPGWDVRAFAFVLLVVLAAWVVASAGLREARIEAPQRRSDASFSAHS